MCVIKYGGFRPDPCWEENLFPLDSNNTAQNCLEPVTFYFELDVRNLYHPVFYSNETNVSNVPYPGVIWGERPTWEIVSKTVVFVPVILCGIIGNLILLHLILRSRRLRTVTNLLIANMAAADLATLIICPWMFMCSDFFQNFILGKLGCKTEGFFECALLLSAVFNLCAVSYDRLTAIVLPYEARLTIRGAHITMVTTWVAGALLATPLIIYRTYTVHHWLDYDEKFCVENLHVLPTYWHVIITLLVWVPLGVMAICYTAIFVKLDRYQQKVIRRGREHPSIVNLKTRVARMMYIIVSVFIVCRLPFTVFVFWRNKKIRDQFAKGQHLIDDENVSNGFIILWSMSHYLIFSNAAINPVIYGLTNENFKREFRNTPLSNWLFGPASSTNGNSDRPSQEKGKEVVLTSKPCPVLQADSGEKQKVWFVEPKCVMVKTDITNCYI